jgi:hypothetical protein
MTPVVVIALALIAVGFIRVILNREETPDDAGDEGSAPGDALEGEGTAPRDASASVSVPPWEDDPQDASGWRLREAPPSIKIGEAPPTLMELLERETEAPPEGPVDKWIMPEPDEALMEHAEDYGIDNGDPDEPMWTPPEPESNQEPEPERPHDGSVLFMGLGVVRFVFDALYLLQAVEMFRHAGNGFFDAEFRLDDPGALEALVVVSGALLLMNGAVLALFHRRSSFVRPAFLIYVLLDLCVRAINVINGLAVGGRALDSTIVGVSLAVVYDLICAWYLFRAQRAQELPS